MKLSERHVNGAAAGMIINYLANREVDDPALLKRLTGFVESGQMTYRQWCDALHTVQVLFPDRPTSFEIGMGVRPEHFGVLGYLLLASSTLGEVIERYRRYHRLPNHGDVIDVDFSAGEVCLQWKNRGNRPKQLSDEVFVTAVIQFVRQATNRDDLTFSRLHFRYAEPKNRAFYEQLFRCPIDFGQEHFGFCLPTSYLQLPLNYADPALASILEQQASALLAALPQQADFVARFRHLAMTALQEGKANADYIAGELGLSRRTLNRRLSNYGLEFSGALRSVRVHLAKQYLENTELSIAEIALMLGYAEQSTFTRAFKAWAGLAPLKYRKQHRADQRA